MARWNHKISLPSGTKLPQTPRFNQLWKRYKLMQEAGTNLKEVVCNITEVLEQTTGRMAASTERATQQFEGASERSANHIEDALCSIIGRLKNETMGLGDQVAKVTIAAGDDSRRQIISAGSELAESLSGINLTISQAVEQMRVALQKVAAEMANTESGIAVHVESISQLSQATKETEVAMTGTARTMREAAAPLAEGSRLIAEATRSISDATGNAERSIASAQAQIINIGQLLENTLQTTTQQWINYEQRPWTSKEPDRRLRETIQSLLEFLGDPRINKDAWVRSDETARSIIIRWLAKATLKQFLKVVDRVAAKHQWDYRRAFWSAYIEGQFVSNSWVAFGTEGAEVATRLAKSSDDKLMRQFATLGKAGSNQAVLLLQIHDLIIADWSHNGRLRIWRRGNSSAPEFGSASYIASQLRANPEFEIAHLPPDGWQAKAEAYIRRHTGIKLLQVDYMPRSRG
jgi:hypothetical protein